MACRLETKGARMKPDWRWWYALTADDRAALGEAEQRIRKHRHLLSQAQAEARAIREKGLTATRNGFIE